MQKKILLSLTSLFSFLILTNTILPQDHSGEIKKCLKYFSEAKSLSDSDNGNLWGLKLYGPMLFVNQSDRFIIANEPDNENYLKRDDEVYCGTLPNEVNIANTSMTWKGKRWTMVMLPLSDDNFERGTLMMHELFHRIQSNLNLPAYNYSCNYFDDKMGRILLRLEWNELSAALNSVKHEKLTHIKNAIILNNYRKQLFPGADTLESRMLMNEGLAEYTGLKLGGSPDSSIINSLLHRISLAEKVPSFVRFFAYLSGPLYCMLLDNSSLQWRKNISDKQNLPELLKSAYKIKTNKKINEAAEKILITNKNSGIFVFENERDIKRKEQLAYYKEKFLNKPVITIPLNNMSIQFNPGNLVPLENIGTVYPTIRITDDWGILNVTQDALLSSDFRTVTISLPDNIIDPVDLNNIKSRDWTLEVKDGWNLKPTSSKGKYILSIQ